MATYSKLPHRVMADDRWIDMSPAAAALFLFAWDYTSRELTDGIVSRSRMARLGPSTIDDVAALAELIEAGFVRPTHDDKIEIVGFLDINRTRAQVEDISRKRAEAGRRSGSSRRSQGPPEQVVQQVAEQVANNAVSVYASVSESKKETTRAPRSADYDLALGVAPPPDPDLQALEEARRRVKHEFLALRRAVATRGQHWRSADETRLAELVTPASARQVDALIATMRHAMSTRTPEFVWQHGVPTFSQMVGAWAYIDPAPAVATESVLEKAGMPAPATAARILDAVIRSDPGEELEATTRWLTASSIDTRWSRLLAGLAEELRAGRARNQGAERRRLESAYKRAAIAAASAGDEPIAARSTPRARGPRRLAEGEG